MSCTLLYALEPCDDMCPKVALVSNMDDIGLSVTFDGKREDYFPDLMKWASENGASVEGFEMVNFKEEGFGLRATRDIKVSLLSVGLRGFKCV